MLEERTIRQERIMRDVGIYAARPSRRVPSAVRSSRLELLDERLMREERIMRDVGIEAARPFASSRVPRRECNEGRENMAFNSSTS